MTKQDDPKPASERFSEGHGSVDDAVAATERQTPPVDPKPAPKPQAEKPEAAPNQQTINVNVGTDKKD